MGCLYGFGCCETVGIWGVDYGKISFDCCIALAPIAGYMYNMACTIELMQEEHFLKESQCRNKRCTFPYGSPFCPSRGTFLSPEVSDL